MKKLFLVFAALATSLAVQAQDNKTTEPTKVAPPAPQEVKESSTNDYLVMKGGKVYFFENSKMSLLDKELTLQNGTKVTATGECNAKDGSKSAMKEGDFLYMNGAIRHTMKDVKKD